MSGGAGALQQKPLRVVVYEGEGSAPLDPDQRLATVRALLEDGHPVTLSSGSGAVSPADDSEHLVFGRFEKRPELEPAQAERLQLHELQDDPQANLALVREQTEARDTRKPGQWKPWFPVIDYDRCTNCMQCLTFCLFGVYGVDTEQKIAVDNEDNCKTDCPACSRVCPEAAILFPKYKAGPINGDVVKEEDLQREAMKVDISALLGGDIYAALKDRSTKARERFSTERDESKALLERKRCLKKLKKDLDIPDEVLMTLPSAGDIEDRARRAKEKAERRRQRSQTVKDSKPAPTQDDWGI